MQKNTRNIKFMFLKNEQSKIAKLMNKLDKMEWPIMTKITKIKISAFLGGYREWIPGMETRQNLFIYPSGKIIFKDYSLKIDQDNNFKDVNTKTEYYIVNEQECQQLTDQLRTSLIAFSENAPFNDVMDGGFTSVEIVTDGKVTKYDLQTPTSFSPLDDCTNKIISITGNKNLWLFN